MRGCHHLKTLRLVVLLCALSACGSKVSYEDPKDALLVDGWSTTDLQNTAEAMTQSLLASKWISGVQSPPIVRLRDVQNRTAEHIDTRAITEKIRVRLIKSGQVLFVSSDRELEQVMKERQLDKEHTLRGQNKPLLHTNYIVTGAVIGDRKKTPKGDVITDYSIILELIHPESGMIYWSDEKEIRKRNTRASVGW